MGNFVNFLLIDSSTGTISAEMWNRDYTSIEPPNSVTLEAATLLKYNDKKFLVIDDFGEFRRSVKTMCQQIGALDIDQAATGVEAVQMCQKKAFDVVISDYNLGEGKDGQQILEELLHRRLLKPGAIFILATAENSTVMVMGALEYQPDAYLTKPFNRQTLQTRLDKLMEKKEALKEIDTALVKGKHSAAIKLCDQQIAQNSRHALACLRIKAELLEDRGNLTDAYAIYNALAKERPLPWAIAGAARTLIKQSNPRAAKALLESVVKSLPNFVDAQDLLAQALINIGDNAEAQTVLEEAIKRSPKAVKRQQTLGEVALLNNDIPVATRAYKQAVNQGRHSVFKQSNAYLKLSHCLTRSLGASPLEDKRVTEEIQRLLQEVQNDYKTDDCVVLRTLLAKADLLKTLNKPDEVNKLMPEIKDRAKNSASSLSADAALDVAEKLNILGETEISRHVISEALQSFGDDPGFKQKCQDLKGEASQQDEAREKAIILNNEGTKAFQAGQLDLALTQFRQAVKLAPQNISIVLNTTQTLLDIYQTQPTEKILVDEALRYLHALKDLSTEDKRHARYQALIRQSKALLAGSS